MKTPQRVAKLEHHGLLTVAAPVSERFAAALYEPAYRLTGGGEHRRRDHPSCRPGRRFLKKKVKS